jgi:hypothetical protein
VPDSWCSKNYASEFADCIIFIIQKQFMNKLRKLSVHSLVLNESTENPLSKILILYIYIRPESEAVCKTVFARILIEPARDSVRILKTSNFV